MQWQIKEPEPEGREKLASLPSVLADLLWQREIKTEAEAEQFLNPSYERDINDPFLFGQMERAVKRVFDALDRGEQITVHGDYDADGVTGSVLMMTTLQDLARQKGSQSKLDFYIPHREREGYGLHIPTIDVLQERGTNLIISVDCGIASREAIGYANDLGIDTIVVDHHEFPEDLPEAILIHPRLPKESYPFPHLAAAGVAWKLASALYVKAREAGLAVHPAAEKWLLDLVAIATVTDIMPLTGENRVLEHFGLKVLRKTKRLGLQKLFEIGGINQKKADTYTVGFQIGPRINAAGRMEHAETAFQLLLSEDEKEAGLLAQKLQEHNSARQVESNKMFEAARLQVLEQKEERLLTAVGDGWSAGLVGLVAGKLANEFARPVLVMGREGEQIVGSGRSVPGFHITEALQEMGECLARFGGHPGACGFSILGEENLTKFTEGVREHARRLLKETDLTPKLFIDAEIRLSELEWNFVEMLEKLAPFGEANPLPRFLTRELEVVQSDIVGNGGKHLRLLLRADDGTTQKFIAFGFGSRLEEARPGASLDVVYEIGVNEWNGSREIQCKITDFRLCQKS